MLLRFVRWSLLVLMSAVVLIGCEASLTPLSKEGGQFGIYGYLSLSGGSHYIRVKDLNTPLVPGSTRVLDARVTIKNLNTGTTEVLTDSIVQFNGTYTHNFRVEQNIQPGVTYRVTVQRPDGRASQATATMPTRTNVSIEKPSSRTDTVSCGGEVLFRFGNVPEGEPVRRSVGVVWADSLYWTDQESPAALPNDGFVPGFAVKEALWKNIQVSPLRPDTTEPINRYGVVPVWCNRARCPPPCAVLDESTMRIGWIHFGPDWPADSVLTDPSASTVKNGLGVFGGIHRDTLYQNVSLDD